MNLDTLVWCILCILLEINTKIIAFPLIEQVYNRSIKI